MSPSEPRAAGPATPVLLACVFASGAAGLLYEVVWARQLAVLLGVSAWAHAAVVASFLAGLAAGAGLFGPLADRHPQPLRLYAWLEVVLGIWGLLTPGLLPLLHRLHRALASEPIPGQAPSPWLELAVAMLALAPPTVLMGGTLPALAKGLLRRETTLAVSVAAVYGTNTAGAAAGALAAGFAILPALGIRGTLAAAAATNLAAAGVMLALVPPADRPWPWASPGDDAPAGGLSRRARRGVLAGFAVSGFAALAAQLAWVRALTLVVGSSVYAFSATLAVYLFGVGAGSLAGRRLLASGRWGRSLVLAGTLEAAAAFAVLGSLAVLGRLPGAFLAAYRGGGGERFVFLQVTTVGLAAAVLLLPTLLLGLLYPLLTALAAGDRGAEGRSVGSAAAANSAGAVAGALLGGLAVLPALGIQGALFAVAALHLAVGSLLWILHEGWKRGWLRAALAAAALAAAAWALPPWDRALMSSGPFVNAERLLEAPAGIRLEEWLRGRSQILYYREGPTATVAVREVGQERLLVINGKTDASRRGDLSTQVLLAQLPLLLHPAPRSALVVGLGSGITAGTAAAHPGLERIDVVEVSPEVVEASAFFREDNGGVLDDARVRLFLASARTFLETTGERWDVLVSEPSNPWIHGMASLFTREFFDLARRRLQPGGIMAQWFHTYGMPEADLRSVLQTFRASFPVVTAWLPQMGDLVLLGSEAPLRLDLGRWKEAVAGPRVAAELGRLGWSEPWDLVRCLLLDGQELSWYAAGAPLQTDDLPRVEFTSPRVLFQETILANMLAIVRHLDGRAVSLPLDGGLAAGAGGLVVEPAGARIAPGTLPAEDVTASWLLTWHALEAAEPQAPDRLGVRAELSVEWREGAARLELRAALSPAPPAAADLRDLLAASGRTPSLVEATVPGGPIVLAGNGPDAAAAVWSCPAPGGAHTRLTLRSEGPGTPSLAGRARCLV